MAQIVIKSWCPLHKMSEAQETFARVSKEKGQTDSIKKVTFYYTVCKEGGKTVSYHDIEQGKLEEALTFLVDFMSGYHGLEGFSYEFTLAASQEDMAAAAQR